jgi:hypothetical protein
MALTAHPTSSTEVKERVEFYIFSSSGLISVKILYPERSNSRYKFALETTNNLNVLQMDHSHHSQRMNDDHVHPTTPPSGSTGDGGLATDECSSMDHQSMMMVRERCYVMMRVSELALSVQWYSGCSVGSGSSSGSDGGSRQMGIMCKGVA